MERVAARADPDNRHGVIYLWGTVGVGSRPDRVRELAPDAATDTHDLVLRIAPALAAGWLLAFTLSLDDAVLASFVSGPAGTTLPLVVFSALRVGVTPEVNALGVMFLALAGLAAALGRWALGRNGGAVPKP